MVDLKGKRILNVGELVDMQVELNEFINPNWSDERTVEDFFVQILDEFSEILGSGVKYKWWTVPKKPLNKHNLKIEIVDALHFALSVVDIVSVEYEDRKQPFFYFYHIDKIIDEEGNLNHRVFMDIFNLMTHVIDNSDFPMQEMGSTCGMICKAFDMSEVELCAFYVAKHTLNRIRVSSGYRNGTYKKVVDGMEDNERLQHVINEHINNPSSDLSDLCDEVEKRFFQIDK